MTKTPIWPISGQRTGLSQVEDSGQLVLCFANLANLLRIWCIQTYTLDFWGGASPRGQLRAYRNGQTPSSAGRRQGKHRHPAPTRGYRFAAPRGAPALTERLQRSRDPGPASAHGAPGIPRMRLSLSKSTRGPQVRLGNGRCALFQISGCQVHLAFQGPRAHLASPGAPAIFTGAPGVIEVHLQSTGTPCEWQVRPVSNKRMPGAPLGIYRCTWGSPGASGIARCAWHLQVHLMRTLLVKARLSGRY